MTCSSVEVEQLEGLDGSDRGGAVGVAYVQLDVPARQRAGVAHICQMSDGQLDGRQDPAQTVRVAAVLWRDDSQVQLPSRAQLSRQQQQQPAAADARRGHAERLVWRTTEHFRVTLQQFGHFRWL